MSSTGVWFSYKTFESLFYQVFKLDLNFFWDLYANEFVKIIFRVILREITVHSRLE